MIAGNKGKVIFVGAGPGDPELLTLKALRHLQSADVVLTDRLVSQAILKKYVSQFAQIIYVGKQNGKNASTPQATINELLLQYAREGKAVVRLKGGDVSIFSNILDELQTLVQHGVPYEIVPGITSALGAAAYGGIPLTARDHATAVRFLTYYKADVVGDSYWRELANTTDTLVFYMSSETLAKVTAKLIKHGIDSNIKLAVIEQATTPMQKVHICNVHQYQKELGTKKFASPSIVIIGKVVNLHQSFKWLENSKIEGEYFTPIENEWLLRTQQKEIA